MVILISTTAMSPWLIYTARRCRVSQYNPNHRLRIRIVGHDGLLKLMFGHGIFQFVDVYDVDSFIHVFLVWQQIVIGSVILKKVIMFIKSKTSLRA